MKVRCVNPNHTDDTPSMHLYEGIAYCFSCGYRCPIDEAVKGEELKRVKKEPTKIEEVLAYIETLPEREIRGLYFPFDISGFYIVWPGGGYYKKRLFDGKSRYVGPRGHRPPVFAYPGCCDHLTIVEGEINARTLWASKVTTDTIASPGGVRPIRGDYIEYMPFYLRFREISIIVDKDIPGVSWGLKLKEELLKRKKKVTLSAVTKDFNQVLQEEGFEGVKKAFKEAVGMRPGL